MKRFGILWWIIKREGRYHWGILMYCWELMISIQRLMLGKMGWRSGKSLMRLRRLSRVFCNRRRRSWKFRRRGNIFSKNLRMRNQKEKIKKIHRMTKSSRIKMKMLLLFLKKQLRILLKRLSINQLMENGTSMMNRNVCGCSRMRNLHKRWRWWSNFSSIN